MTELFQKLFSRQMAVMAVFWLLFLTQMTFDKHDPRLEFSDIVFTASYLAFSLFINHVLVPKFFYSGRYWLFFIGLFATIGIAMLTEELVLEQLLFPGSEVSEIFNPIHAYIFIGSILIVFMALKLGYDAWHRQVIINQLQKENNDSQLNHLKSQIGPHFLFNNLNNLYSKSLENAPETPELIHKMANLMRYMLYESGDKFVPLHKEIEHISDYVELQRVQLEERGQVKLVINYPESLALKIAPLLLITFVENCFKHSFSQVEGLMLIEIRIDVSGSKLQFECVNPYSYDDDRVNNDLPHGIGLKNVKSRLNIMYPEKHRLLINDDGGFFRVELNLELSNL